MVAGCSSSLEGQGEMVVEFLSALSLRSDCVRDGGGIFSFFGVAAKED